MSTQDKTPKCPKHPDRPVTTMFGYYMAHCQECLDRIWADPRSRWIPDPPDFPWSA